MSFKILFYTYLLLHFIYLGIMWCVYMCLSEGTRLGVTGQVGCLSQLYSTIFFETGSLDEILQSASPSDHLDLSSQCWDYGLEPLCPVLLHGYWGSEHGSPCLQSTSPTKPFPQPLYQVLKEQEMFSPLGKLFHDQLNYDIIILFLRNYLFQSKPQPVCPCLHSN